MGTVAGPSSAKITLRALIVSRWVLVGLLAAGAAFGLVVPRVIARLLAWVAAKPDPWLFSGVLLAWAASTWASIRALRTDAPHAKMAGVHLLVDATALTALLAITGGASNPFTIVYFVPITLATQVSPRWTWTLAGYCVLCFAALFALVPLPPAPPGHEAHFAGHLRGMWLAFGATGMLVTYFVHHIALSLARQREELERLRREALQDRHLAALGTLAAGAAHELGTPLATIKVLASELEHMDEPTRREALTSIRSEVNRCKEILHSMASPEPRVSTLGRGEVTPWSFTDLADAVDGGGDVRVEVGSRARSGGGETTLPREALAQVLRELITNAREACSTVASPEIVVVLDVDGPRGVLEVRDNGVGMAADTAEAAFDAFFTTRPEGEGMGLGLFLARAHVRQLGGEIHLDSRPKGGTTVRVELPLRSNTPGPPAVDLA